MIEKEIELFRVGGKASRGITPDILAEVATQDCAASPAAICFGHPKSDTPAAGTITGLRAAGNSLFGTVKTLSEKAIEGIQNGEWLNRSAAFFDPHHEANPRPGKWSFRHLGLLGAAAPGIPGMGTLQKALAFSAADDTIIEQGDPADAVVFAGKPTPVHFIFDAQEPTTMEKTPEQIAEDTRIAAAAAAQTERETQFAARVRNQFEATNGSTVDRLVRDGKVLPAEADGLKLVFNAFDPEADELTFGAGDKATKSSAAAALASFLDGALGKRVPTGKRESPAHEFKAADATSGTITAAANKLVTDEGLTFDAAVERIEAEREAA